MKFSEALNQGYVFTGVTWRNYETDKGNKYKDLARKLKIKYNVNYKIVVGDEKGWLSLGSKAIVGDKNFDRLWNLIYQRKLDDVWKDISAKIKKAEDEYKAKLLEIEKIRISAKEDLEFIESLKRK